MTDEAAVPQSDGVSRVWMVRPKQHRETGYATLVVTGLGNRTASAAVPVSSSPYAPSLAPAAPRSR